MFNLLQKNNSTVNLLLFSIAILLLWGTNIIEPQFISHYYDEHPMVLYKPLMFIQNFNSYAGQFLSLAFVLLNMLLLYRLNSINRLIENRSVTFLFLFVILSATIQDFRQLNPMQPALTFVLLGITSLFQLYKNERELQKIFECGIFFSLATMFYAPTICFIVLMFLGLMTLVPFYWRQWVSAILGYILPTFVTFALGYCFGFIDDLGSMWKINLTGTQVTNSFNNLFLLCFCGYLILLLLCSILYSFSEHRKVATRKYYLLLFIAFIILVLCRFFSLINDYTLFFLGIIPATIFISNYLEKIRRKFWTEMLFIIILVFEVLIQMFPDKLI